MLLSLEDVTKIISNRLLLHHVSAVINEGDRIGIVGENGAGKSTLLRIITGAEQIDKGSRGTKGGLTIGLLEQNAGVDGKNTVYEEMRSGAPELNKAQEDMRRMEGEMAALTDHDGPEAKKLWSLYSAAQAFFECNGGYELDARIEMILSGVGFGELDRELSCAALSGGEKTRLALARLLLQGPELLLLDEPTNHLDFDSVLWLENYLRQYKGTVVAVSHDRYFLDRICSRIWEVDNAGITSYRGNYTAYSREREARFLRDTEVYEAQRREEEKLLDFIARNKVRASTAALAKSREKELQKLREEGLQKPRPPFNLSPLRMAFRFELGCGAVALQVEGLNVHVDADPGMPVLCRNLCLKLGREERVAVVGGNGVGKSTFLKTILQHTGNNQPMAGGPVRWGLYSRVSYFAQDDTGLGVGRQNVLEEVMNHYPRTTRGDARNALACLGFKGEDVEKPVWGLSGGEKARLKLTLLMYRDGNILVLDEPTNHLDIPAKEAVEKALCAFAGPVLVVSHDRYFLSRVPTRVVELQPDGFVDYPGGFAEYQRAHEEELQRQEALRQARREERRRQQAEKAEDGRRGGGHRSRQERAQAARDIQRRARLEKEIAALESRREEINGLLQDPEVCRDPKRAAECCDQLAQAEKELDACMEEWIELEEAGG